MNQKFGGSEMVKWSVYLTTAYRPCESQRNVFDRTQAMVEAAESLGYDGAWLLEHHFTRYGICGSPLMLAGNILGATKRLKVGTAVTVIPLEHPVRLAENVALLDQMSGGRLRFGIGRGYFFKDYEVLGVDIRKNTDMMTVWMDIILSAWVTGKCKAENGFLNFPEVTIYPEPLTKPHPPVYVACSSPTRTEWAAQRGFPMLMDYLSEDEEKLAQLELYRQVALESGHDPDAVDHVLSGVAYVGDPNFSDRIREHLVWWEREQLNASRLFAPENRGVENYAYYHRQREAAILRGHWEPEHRCERILQLSPTGTPEQCIERLQHTVDVTGIRHIALGFEGLGDTDIILDSMYRFMTEVAPHVKFRGRPWNTASTVQAGAAAKRADVGSPR
jgi:alkanal monooxygenase alpha chain